MTTSAVFTLFAIIVGVLLFIDLFIAHPAGSQVTIRSSAIWSAIWIGAGVAFGTLVMGLYGGTEAISQYLTAYVVEKTLSVDNVFLWLLVFSGLNVPAPFQRRVLIYGVVGAVIFRTVLVLAGTVIVERFAFILLIAGVFLIYAGIKLWREGAGEETPEELGRPRVLMLLERIIPTTDGWRDDRFIVKENNRWLATPLLMVLLLIELTDVVLALDALPAGLSITTDITIILTANLFAVLGLRSLYFLLVGFVERMHYLKSAVGVILIYIGGTLLMEQLLDGFHPDTLVSLGVIVFVLTGAIWASLRRERALALHGSGREGG